MNINFKDFSQRKNNFEKIKSVSTDLIWSSLKTSNPLITIAIPTYKRSSLLKFAIESAVYQKEANCEYEIIIVDNEESANETETEKVAKSFVDYNVLYYKNVKNIGMVGNWNRCIELSRGKWIAFLHDDDLLSPTYVHDVLKMIEKRKNIGAIVANNIVIHNEFSVSKQNDFFKGSLRMYIRQIEKYKLMRIFPFESLIFGNVYGAPTCGNIFNKEHMVDLGGFNDEYFPTADWFFLYELNREYKVYKTMTHFGFYRIFENESLNRKTIMSFVTQAIMFRSYLANQTKFGRLLHLLFEDEWFFQSLKWGKGWESELQYEFEQLRSESSYNYRPFRYSTLYLFQRSYWLVKRVINLVKIN